MRIAIITGEFPALSETFVINHVVSLLDLGHDVTVFAFKSDAKAETHDIVRTRGLSQIVRPLDPFISESAARRLLRRLTLLLSTGWQWPALTLRALDPRIGGRAALNLSLFASAQVFKRQEPFDIVHCHFGWSGILGAMLKKATASSSKLVVTFHGADVNVADSIGSAPQRKLMFSVGDWFTAVSQFTRNKSFEIGCPRDRCSIWHMGVDTRQFDYRVRQVADGEPVQLLTVGRLVEKKGIEYVIRALPLLNPGGRRLEYNVIGDGPLRAFLEGLAHDLGVGDRVIFHGARNSDYVRSRLSQAHIFALTSVTAKNNDREGLPVTLIEAAASGLPILATHHNGLPEIVLDGQSGFLVPERDSQSLAERLQYLIDNPGSWGEMGRAGRQFVEREFALDQCAGVIDAVYERLVSARLRSG